MAQKKYDIVKNEEQSKVKRRKSRKKTSSTSKRKALKLTLRNVDRSVIYTKKKVDPRSKWAIFELTDEVTFEDFSEAIENDVLQLLGEKAQYFIPVYSEEINGNIVSDILFEGYFFVKISDNLLNIADEIRTDHIKGIMKRNSKIIEIPGKKINDFKKEVYDKLLSLAPKRKQIISPKIGILSNLKGEVLSVNKRNMTFVARFKCSSRLVEAPVNFINYRTLSSEDNI